MRVKSLLACVAVCPFLVATSQPVRIQPSSKWVLDYAEDSCRLIRRFGEGATETKLEFQGVAPNEMNMLLIGGTLHPQPEDAEIKARFLPGTGEPFVGTAAEAEHGTKGAAFWTSFSLAPNWESDADKLLDRKKQKDRATRPDIDLAERQATLAKRSAWARSTTELSVTPAVGRAMVLETGSLAKPIAMFDECERDLLRQWGIDPDVQDKIIKPVWAPSVLSWFSPSDYPIVASLRGEEATVNARLAVDSNGKVTKCASVSAYNASDFNKVVCEVLLTRGRFSPAELADGTKVASYYSQNITFKIPRF